MRDFSKRFVAPAMLGILCASLAFSLALATAPAAGARAQPALRSVGSGLRFSNPLLLPGQDPLFPAGGDASADPDGFDLGNATFGSQVVRYLTGLGGVQPYIFAFAGTNTTPLVLDSSGRLNGTLPASGSNALGFRAQIIDAAGATRTGYFRIGTSVSDPGEFRFAMSRLSDGRVGMDYITKIETIGGPVGSVFFSLVSGSVSLNGTALARLEDAGLRLFGDGTLAGRPLSTGTLSFTARAEAQGRRAAGFLGVGQDQTFTINLGALSSVQSVLATIQANVRASSFGLDRDTFSFNFLINTDGLTSRDFANQEFVLRVGGQTFRTDLDFRGQRKSGDLRVKLDAPAGVLTVRGKNLDLSALAGPGNTVGTGRRIEVVQVQLGESFLGTEPVEFFARERGGSTTLKYALNRDRQIGGLFQISSIVGNDTFTGTAFRLRFLIAQVPSVSDDRFGQQEQATVNIGPGFTQTVPLFNGANFYPPDGVAFLRLNPRKRIGDMDTYSLSPSETGIQRAVDANGQLQTFLLGLRVRTSTLDFFGEASRQIRPFVF